MNEATLSARAGVPALAAGGSAFRLYEDRRETVMAAAVSLGGLTCLAIGIRGASKVYLFFDPFVLAGISLVAVAAGFLARPHLARRRLRLRIRRSGGMPWNDPALWSQRETLMLARRGVRLTGTRGRILALAAIPAALSLMLVVVNFWSEIALRAGPFRLVAVVAPLVVAQLAIAWLRRRRLSLEVGFASFPCRVGEQRAQVQLTFAKQPPKGSAPPVATLQCIAERRNAKGWWTYDIARIVPAADAFPMPGASGGFAVEFDIPSDAPPTDVLVLPAHSWQLVVSVETPSGWYDGAVAAPVFAVGPLMTRT